MNEEDISLCISCAFSGYCAEMTETLVAYECDAYEPEESNESR